MHDAFRSVVIAVALVALRGCSGDDPEQPPDSTPKWQVVLDGEDLDQAVVSVWGSSADDVFAVGGGFGNTGYGALALHFDGSAWQDLGATGDNSFWWVNGTGPDDVWMVGQNGRIDHFDGATFTSHDYATTATLFGVWAFSPNDVWAVGGTPGGGTSEPNDLVLHYDGTSFTEVALPEQLGYAHFKVWGTSSDDLYVVGEHGLVWHKVGDTWTSESGVASSTLFTVYGCSATEIYAVGGFDVLRSSGDGSWEKQPIGLSNAVNGVSCAAPGAPVLVGGAGLKQRLVDGTWIDEFTDPPYDDLHGAWAEGDGVFWAVGGQFIASPMPNTPRDGIVARFAAGEIANTIE